MVTSFEVPDVIVVPANCVRVPDAEMVAYVTAETLPTVKVEPEIVIYVPEPVVDMVPEF